MSLLYKERYNDYDQFCKSLINCYFLLFEVHSSLGPTSVMCLNTYIPPTKLSHELWYFPYRKSKSSSWACLLGLNSLLFKFRIWYTICMINYPLGISVFFICHYHPCHTHMYASQLKSVQPNSDVCLLLCSQHVGLQDVQNFNDEITIFIVHLLAYI